MSPRKPVVLLNDTSADLHHGCALVTQTIEQLSAEHGLMIAARSKVHADWRENAPLRESMANASLIIVNGEGTIHHDRPAGRILLEAGPWASERGIPAVLINATWQSNSDSLAAMARTFTVVSVRESASAAELEAQAVSTLIVPDLAIWHDWPAASARSGILVSDSVVPAVTVALDRLRKHHGGSSLSLHYGQRGWRAAVGTLRRHGVGDTLSPAANLRGLGAALTERRSETPDVARFMQRISACRLLVTGRFHAFILALATRTPVLVAGSNTHKLVATLRDAGLSERRVIDPADVTPDGLEAAARWSPEESAALDRFVPASRAAIRALFADLHRLAR